MTRSIQGLVRQICVSFAGFKLANNSPQAFVLYFCFTPSCFKYFSRKMSTNRLFQESIFTLSTVVSPVCFAVSTFHFKQQFFFRLITYYCIVIPC